ncbi:MAG: extracellular solute-binding protein [Lachnospiraceae bacterium]|nr:extracellular solute-binding protein [Lachnospiraceae bacterium]
MRFGLKLFRVILVALLVTFLYYGAHCPFPARDDLVQETAKGSETIYFWYTREELSDVIGSAAVSFGQENGVRVIPVLAAENEYPEQLYAASVSGERCPDAYLLPSNLLEKAYLAGMAVDLASVTGTDPLASQEEADNGTASLTCPEALLNAGTYEGKLLMRPLSFDTTVLVYRTEDPVRWAHQAAVSELTAIDMDIADGITDESVAAQIAEMILTEEDLDPQVLADKEAEYLAGAVPATIPDLLQFAGTYDVPAGTEGILEWDVNDILYNYWFLGGVIDLCGPCGDDRGSVRVNNIHGVECLETYQNLREFFSIDSEQISYESCVEDFLAGKYVFTVGSTDILQRLQAAKDAGTLGFDYGFALLPDISDTYESKALCIVDGVVVNGYSEHGELAERFAEYLTTECADMLYERCGIVPADRTVTVRHPELEIFFRQAEKSIALPKLMETQSFWLELEAAFTSVWDGEDPAQTLDTLQEKLESGSRLPAEG